MKKHFLYLLFLLTISVIGCQKINHLDNNLNLTEDVSSIEVYEWDSNHLHTIIMDTELITELVNKLNRASTYSTADMDYPLPDYKLIFKDKGDKELLSIGYYNEVVNLGLKGRYLDVSKDIIYRIELQLSFP